MWESAGLSVEDIVGKDDRQLQNSMALRRDVIGRIRRQLSTVLVECLKAPKHAAHSLANLTIPNAPKIVEFWGISDQKFFEKICLGFSQREIPQNFR
ncbi:hypothetical protein ACH3XW_49000 [Acanthocheilonema viteae]